MPFGMRGGGFGKGRGHRGRGPRRLRRIGQIEHCVCPACGTIAPHQFGLPCFQTICPGCGAVMTRQFSVPGVYDPLDQKVQPKPVVDQNICRGCAKCVPVCPEKAIEMRSKKAFILPEKCTNCRICIPACPFSAII
ncbi:4Fe-4S binding protein [candidate division KSB1 bacterium]|nr:4Fe-4S binding protein [candidate division KSB1 bacterium]